LSRNIHPDFQHFLDFKSQEIIGLYTELRALMFALCPDCNELLYHTHALTSVYSISEKMGDGFCHIPIYKEHLNLGFNKGNLLDDPDQLLEGTGKLIRHIPITKPQDFKNTKVKSLIKSAIKLAKEDMKKESKLTGVIISKIKK